MQHTTKHCNSLQRTATHCYTLQLAATQVFRSAAAAGARGRAIRVLPRNNGKVTRCDTMQHTITHHHSLQLCKTATHCNSLQHRSFDQQQQQVPEDEQLEYSLVTMDKYFVNCFNLKAKPDFRKNGGADTEHCEQVLVVKICVCVCVCVIASEW